MIDADDDDEMEPETEGQGVKFLVGLFVVLLLLASLVVWTTLWYKPAKNTEDLSPPVLHAPPR